MNQTWIVITLAALVGCSAPAMSPPATANPLAAESLARSPLDRPVQVQAGAKQFVLGVTDDGHAIFQQGTALYSTPLAPHAARQFIANTSAAIGANHPLVFVSGNVAFIYPDSDSSGTIVSRLIVWTAAAGPKLVATASLGAPGYVAASPDSRGIVFVANASAHGTTGDLVSASADGSGAITLVSGANINPAGACVPQVGFDRKRSLARDDGACLHRPAHPVAGYCIGNATTATLSRWIDGTRHDLISDIHGYPLWSTDSEGEKLFTIVGHPRASQRPASIDAQGVVTQLEDVFTGGGTINSDDSIMTFAKPSTTFEMHRFTGQPPRANLVTDMGPSFNIYFNMYPNVARDYATGFTSNAGMALFYSPTQLIAVDTTQAPATPMVLAQNNTCFPSFEPFSADSQHALLYCPDATSVFALYDGGSAGVMRKLTTGSAEDGVNFAVDDGVIAYADNLVHTPADQDLSATIDIKLVDLAAPTLAPRTLVSNAYSSFFPTRNRRRIVFTSDADPTAQGLFVLGLP
jgi:hypothetical protein